MSSRRKENEGEKWQEIVMIEGFRLGFSELEEGDEQWIWRLHLGLLR